MSNKKKSSKVRDEEIINRIIIRLRVYAAFMELAGCTAKDVKPKEITEEAQEELRAANITGARANAIMLAVSQRI